VAAVECLPSGGRRRRLPSGSGGWRRPGGGRGAGVGGRLVDRVGRGGRAAEADMGMEERGGQVYYFGEREIIRGKTNK